MYMKTLPERSNKNTFGIAAEMPERFKNNTKYVLQRTTISCNGRAGTHSRKLEASTGLYTTRF